MRLGTILYLSYDGMTDPLGQSQVIPYLAGLAAKGHSIHIVSCEKKKAFEKNKEQIKLILNQNNISWHPISYTKNPPVISTLYDIINISRKANALFKIIKFDIVHCRSYITGMVGLSLKRKYHCKFIFDMRGFWADERVDGKLWNLKNPLYKIIYKFFKRKEREMLRNADFIISLTHKAKQIIHSWKLKSHDELPIEVIPCCVDMRLFSSENIDPIRKEKLRKELNIPNEKFILSYLGALGTWYLLDEMLDFFIELLKLKPSGYFLFITPEKKSFILQKAKEKKIPYERILIVMADRETVPVMLSLSDASIFFIKPAFSKNASSPTKQGEIMSMGIPLICNSGIGDTDEIISESMSGITVKHFDKKNCREAISKLESLKNSSQMNSRAIAEKYFSLAKGIDSYNKVYVSLLKDQLTHDGKVHF